MYCFFPASCLQGMPYTIQCNESQVYWDIVQGNTKNEIKDILLSTLISNDIGIVRGGANTIATIASIEIPRG